MRFFLLYLKIYVRQWGVALCFLLLNGIGFHCAPYSLPEKKSYTEKEDPYTYYMQSVEAFQSKDFPLALEHINHAILLNQDMAKFYQLKGDIYRAQFNDKQAISAYELALKKRSNFIEVQEAIGDIYLEQKNYDQAIRAYKKVSGLNPERTDMLLKIADCYLLWHEVAVAQYHLDNYEKTARQYRQPLTDTYFEIRADAFYQQAQFDAAISALQHIQNPARRALQLFGLSYYALGDYERGVGYFNKLLNLDKEEGVWYYYRGIYFFKKNDLGDAKSQFLLALRLNNMLTEISYYLGKIYLAEGDPEAAREQFINYQNSGTDPACLQEVSEILRPEKPE
jgi:tetratricopeptide (TPR) repeat protein